MFWQGDILDDIWISWMHLRICAIQRINLLGHTSSVLIRQSSFDIEFLQIHARFSFFFACDPSEVKVLQIHTSPSFSFPHDLSDFGFLQIHASRSSSFPPVHLTLYSCRYTRDFFFSFIRSGHAPKQVKQQYSQVSIETRPRVLAANSKTWPRRRGTAT